MGSLGVLGGDSKCSTLNLYRDSTNVNVVQAYHQFGVPPQLAQLLAEEDSGIALRMYILDNSGSMGSGDGQIVSPHETSYYNQVRPATRWQELKHMALQHADWNAKLGMPSEFILLNSVNSSSPVDGRDFVRIDAHRGNPKQQISSLQALLDRSFPGGSTPLTECLQDLRRRLRMSAPELQQKGRKLMLVLVTDGVPNGSRHAFVESIRMLAREYPVHIVVRLCTNDSSVAEFFNQVDQEVELSLDIVDDFQNEAKNVHYYNPWLTYSHILHTIREAGTLSKMLDLIDERTLAPMEVGLVAQFLLRGVGQAKYSWNPEQFLGAAERDVLSAHHVFDIRRRTMSPVMDIKALRAAVLPGKFSIAGQVASAVGLGGVAEAWYEGRNLWDAFRNPKAAPTPEEEEEEAEEEDEPPQCIVCTRKTDGTYPHCCRTCQRSGGKEHGPSCNHRHGQAVGENLGRRSLKAVEPAGSQQILQLGTVPAGVCFLCARRTDGIFPHCCRTCAKSGGTSHGPTCEKRHGAMGYTSCNANAAAHLITA
jgi:hypothetical protein